MDWDVVDDFESQYAEELEMMRDEDDFDVAPRSRRALALASPLLPPGVGRKRPIEESPLPLIPSDSEATPAGLPRKVPRLSGSATPLSSIPEGEEDAHSTTAVPAAIRSSSLTPRRHKSNHKNSRSKLQVSTTAAEERQTAVSGHRRSDSSASNKRSLTAVSDSPIHEPEPYSPPSPYSLSPSPSPSLPHSLAAAAEEEDTGRQSTTHGVSSRVLSSPSHFTVPDDEAERGWQQSDRGEGVYSGAGTSPSSRRTRTPGKSTTPRSAGSTPASTGRYKRSLDVSRIESGDRSPSPFRNLKGSSLMERFEATYSSLKSRAGGEHAASVSLPPADDDMLSDPEYSLSPLSGQLDSRSSALSQHPSEVAPVSLIRSRVLSRAPPCPHVTVTSSDGRRVYLRIKDGGRKGGAPGSLPLARDSQLLSVPFARLRDSVEEERRQKLIEQSDHLLHSLRRGDQDEESQSLFGDSEDPDVVAAGGERDQQLWVEKYSPRLYTELLSDDGINRTLLSWLKLWEEVVFGRSLAGGGGAGRGGRRGEERGQKNKPAKPPAGKQGRYRVEYQDPSFFTGPEALDETRRPKLKLALLCGAPGLGKTTLAHVIARHAGYNVVEMNASDDRSPEVFQRWIETSTQMQAVLTAQTRPNCLIIDEIDGAPTAAINVLIELVKRKETGKKKKGKSSGGPLSRPIICICNDQYAPSLRQLRQHALVLFFPPTITSRLASRLLQVTRQERMAASMSTLMALCEKTGNDIRSCLNTAQFIQCRCQDLTLAAVQAASVGRKDAQRSLFSFWKEIFQLPSGKRNTLNQGPLRPGDGVALGSDRTAGEGYLSTNAVRFYQILSATTATGEYEKMAQGLFENYPHIRFRDPNLQAVSLAQDWMVFTDTVQRYILHRQDYSFTGYLPFLSVAFHFLFAAPSKPQIRYPHTSFEVFQQQQRSSHLLSSLQMEVPPHIRRTVSPRLLTGEILSPLLEIIAPTFRPVSIQLYTPREKQQLVDLVDTMISYSLTYRQERGPDGQYTYILDPNVEELCRFPGLPQRKQLSYSAKQLIAREIEVEKMRRAERALTGKSTSSEESSKEAGSVTPTRTASTRTQVSSGSHSTAKAPKKQAPVLPTVKEEKLPLDFFGRVLKTKPNEGGRRGTAGGSNASTTHPLWFRFNEGFSNAVRRPIRIQDLL